MSGAITPLADTSVPADRVAFRDAQATRLLNCQLPMPVDATTPRQPPKLYLHAIHIAGQRLLSDSGMNRV